jgi:hypothetical protein
MHADGHVSSELNSSLGWKAELSEVSAGVYRITVHDPTGQIRYSATGEDPELLKQSADELRSTTIITP